MPRIFRVTPAKRRPLYPHTIHADRLIPFRPDNTLDAANRRQEALDALREISDSKKVRSDVSCLGGGVYWFAFREMV